MVDKPCLPCNCDTVHSCIAAQQGGQLQGALKAEFCLKSLLSQLINENREEVNFSSKSSSKNSRDQLRTVRHERLTRLLVSFYFSILYLSSSE